MIAIGILLIHFNHRQIFDWNGLTLNAIIAIFSVISKSMLAYTLSECLGQAKWIWISSQERPLNDMDLIDSGSRGPLGSFRILTQSTGRSFISVGAIIIILSLVIDPFVQLTVGKENSVKFENSLDVQIAYAKRHSKKLLVLSDESADIVGVSQADLGMQSAVFDGLVQSDFWISQQLQHSCSSGNCTWDTFASLAVCSGCNNLTDQIKRINQTMEFQGPFGKPFSVTVPMLWHLPNGLIISDALVMTAWGTSNVTQTISFTSFDTLIWSMTIMNLTTRDWPMGSDTVSAMLNQLNVTKREEPWINNNKISAIECGLWYCVNSYQSTVRNGILSEIVQPTGSKRDPGSWLPIRSDSANGGFKRIIPPRYPHDTPLIRGKNQLAQMANLMGANLIVRRTDLQIGEGFNVSQAASLSLVGLLRETTTYPTNQSDLANMTLPIAPGHNFTPESLNNLGRFNAFVGRATDGKGPDSYNPPAMESLYHSQDLEATFAKLAKSITINIRQASDSDNRTVITGKEGKSVVLIRIRAWFLVLPAVLIVAGGIFLVIVLHYTRKSGLEFWGTNTLPIVYWGGKMEPIFDEIDMKVSTMEHTAKQHLVQFSIFQSLGRDRTGTISGSETHEVISPSRISADVVNIASPSRTSLIVRNSSPDALSIASDYA